MSAELPTAVWSGSFKLLGVEIKCHTLSDGQRIVEAESVDAFVRALRDSGVLDDPQDHPDLEAFARWRAGK
mgnify:CR=1 FL=1